MKLLLNFLKLIPIFLLTLTFSNLFNSAFEGFLKIKIPSAAINNAISDTEQKVIRFNTLNINIL